MSKTEASDLNAIFRGNDSSLPTLDAGPFGGVGVALDSLDFVN